MQTLKNNNSRLHTALEESKVNVSQWKTQLQKYKEENDSLKKKVRQLLLQYMLPSPWAACSWSLAVEEPWAESPGCLAEEPWVLSRGALGAQQRALGAQQRALGA